MNKILFIIPARSGSKRIINKNIKKLDKNESLIEIKINNCIKSNLGDVIVSTDSKKIAHIAKKNGAKVPYLRSKKLSSPTATMMSCVVDVINYLNKKDIIIPKYIAIMPPTYPFTKPESIRRAFSKLRKMNKFNSICSFSKSIEHPFSYIDVLKDKVNFDHIKYKGHVLSEFERTQDYPPSHVLSGSIRISKTSFFKKFLKNKSPLIKNYVIDMNSCIGFKLSKREAYDINDPDDFEIAKFLSKNKNFLTK
jgi:CMP-N,N'-diacetyllegionaminic acid synthase